MQPQQAKMINETEKRLNMLFDLINCEALSENSTEKILEICRGSSPLSVCAPSKFQADNRPANSYRITQSSSRFGSSSLAAYDLERRCAIPSGLEIGDSTRDVVKLSQLLYTPLSPSLLVIFVLPFKSCPKIPLLSSSFLFSLLCLMNR